MYWRRRWWSWMWPLVASMVTLWAKFPSAATAKTRLVSTKYGTVQGVIKHLGDLLGDVEVFMGVPYASPPIEEGRFTPTNTPTPWDGVLDATTPPAVCPQLLPDLNDAEKIMPKKKLEFIQRIMPALANQSEDCLKLSIYAPIMVVPGSEVYPVMVYFHGESFSWGSGSIYDGSVLAAYGRVVIVTINYRLGPLGFLNTYGGGSGVVSNFALLDQITALSWVGENIGQFGGDPNRVTLFGRDTGAACISHLAQSPIVPPGLFQRVILLSGAAWCPWAHVTSPLSMTLRLAVALDCPVPKDPGSANPNTVECLRNASLDSLMNAAGNITAPAFTPTWGPSEDGVVVARSRQTPSQQSRPRIDWIIGVTPHEAWSWLSEEIITEGVAEDAFEKVIKSWVRNTRKHHLREIVAVTKQEYTDWTTPSTDPLKRRDLLLDLLSDAGTVAPLLQGVENLLDFGKVFLFVCDLSAQLPDQIQQPGWEISLVFGAGLSDVKSVASPHVPLSPPILAELSEDVITLLTNFAKSGDPNLPRESPSPGYAAIAWPRHTKDDRRYLKIGVPPSIGSRYRAHRLALWSWLVPELEAAGAQSPLESDTWEVSNDPSLFYGEVRPPDPWYFLLPPTSTSSVTTSITTELIEVAPVAVSTSSGHLIPKITTTLALSPTMGSHHHLQSTENGEFVKYSTALLVTIGLGVSLLLLNGLIFMLLFWRRSGTPHGMHRCDGSHLGMESVMSVPRVGSLLSMTGTYGGNMMTPLGGSFGGPPDCIKSSYDKLHLTAEELQRFASSSPLSMMQKIKPSPESQRIPQTFQPIPNVIPLKKTQLRSRETSFTLDPTFRNLESPNVRCVESDDECRLRSVGSNPTVLRRRPSTPCIVNRVPQSELPTKSSLKSPEDPRGITTPDVSDRGSDRSSDQDRITTSEIHSQSESLNTISEQSRCSAQCQDHRRTNGWATFVGNSKRNNNEVPDPPPPPRISTLRRDTKVTIIEEAVHRL